MPAPEAADKPMNCGNCENYRRRHTDPAQHAAAEAAGHPVSAGICWRYPTPVSRQPQDCCSEHSELQKNRLRYLARLIAHNGMD